MEPSKVLLVMAALPLMVAAGVERVWLTYKSNYPDRIMINWETTEAGPSQVDFGLTQAYGQTAGMPGNTNLHHVEIPVLRRGALHHYRLATGAQITPDRTFRSLPASGTLRVAVLGNWWLEGDKRVMMRDSIDILMTSGDNAGNVSGCGIASLDCTARYGALISAYPYIFDAVPFMPTLGNHDHQVDLPGRRYDTNGTAFMKFFPLPDLGWAWHFDVPEFKVRFFGLDLSHEQDVGTPNQPGHDMRGGSPQHRWYRDFTDTTKTGFAVSMSNGSMNKLRNLGSPTWSTLFYRGNTALFSDGYFVERSVQQGRVYYNTSSRTGTLFTDQYSAQIGATSNYTLITLRTGWDSMRVEIKSLATGQVIQVGGTPMASTFGPLPGYVPSRIRRPHPAYSGFITTRRWGVKYRHLTGRRAP